MKGGLECPVCKSTEIEVTGKTSDGFHTFDELYEHRCTLFIALCAQLDAHTPTGFVWRSKKHSDGTMFPGWFIMGIGTKPGAQITYHLPIARWADAEWLGTENAMAPAWDGHTPSDVLKRLLELRPGSIERWAKCQEGDGCDWMGTMDKLVEDGNGVTHCPNCGSTAILEDIGP